MDALKFRLARRDDICVIVKMLVDDELGKQREEYQAQIDDKYYQAFAQIEQDKNNELIVAEMNNQVIGTLQLTFIPGLTYKGGTRALIEAVRIDSAYRGRGFGKQLFQYAINRARDKNCHMVQLTTNKIRVDAVRFYESIGFQASHVGMKLLLV